MHLVGRVALQFACRQYWIPTLKTSQYSTCLSRAVIDEDVPGGGSFYCVECSRYLTSEQALVQHKRTKPHKRR